MIAPTRRATVIGAIVVLAITLLVEHVRDSRRDDEVQQLRGIISRDSTARLAATARTHTEDIRADTAVTRSSRADSGWKAARHAANSVPVIVASAKADTVKIRELVRVIDTLRIAGDSLARAVSADTAAILQLKSSFAGERSAWSTERRDLAHALDVSSSRRRHWGLGATAGYGVMRDNATGDVHAGPTLSFGLTYRW